MPFARPAGFLVGFLAAAVFFLVDRLAVDFVAFFVAVDLLVEVFFFGDRLALVFLPVFLAPAVFFFSDRLAVFLPAGFFFAVRSAVFFLAAIYVAPVYRRLFTFQSLLGRLARKNIYGSALRSGEG